MKKAVIRLLALALVAALAYGISCALADGGDWTCENCGQAGNIGNFCFNCAAPRPDSGEWTCPNCGQAGNKGNFCFNCAAARAPGADPRGNGKGKELRAGRGSFRIYRQQRQVGTDACDRRGPEHLLAGLRQKGLEEQGLDPAEYRIGTDRGRDLDQERLLGT